MTTNTAHAAAPSRPSLESGRSGCPELVGGFGWVSSHPGPWFALIWAPVLLLGPLVDAAIAAETGRIVLLLLLAAVFGLAVCLPFPVIWKRTQPRWVSESAAGVLLILCTLYLFGWSEDRVFIFPLLAIATAVAVRPLWALSVISALTISGAFAAGFEAHSLGAAMFLGFSTFLAGVAVYLVQPLISLVAELTRTQDQLADVAVSEERLRFARDLHDLLGHTLSVIVVKAEAVRRMLDIDPAAARAHAADIESIGRHALAEVREAATGYRSMTLHDEIANARTALSADDITLEVAASEHPLDAKTDSLLGWVVREATTNILRHSRARVCRLVLTTRSGLLRLEVTDDGDGTQLDIANSGGAGDGEDAAVKPGSGLRGLRERVEELGGEMTAEPNASGFRLIVTIPAPAPRGSR